MSLRRHFAECLSSLFVRLRKRTKSEATQNLQRSPSRLKHNAKIQPPHCDLKPYPVRPVRQVRPVRPVRLVRQVPPLPISATSVAVLQCYSSKTPLSTNNANTQTKAIFYHCSYPIAVIMSGNEVRPDRDSKKKQYN